METPPTTANISIDDFRKVELQVATINSAEVHPTNKLLALQVDLVKKRRVSQ